MGWYFSLYLLAVLFVIVWSKPYQKPDELLTYIFTTDVCAKATFDSGWSPDFSDPCGQQSCTFPTQICQSMVSPGGPIMIFDYRCYNLPPRCVAAFESSSVEPRRQNTKGTFTRQYSAAGPFPDEVLSQWRSVATKHRIIPRLAELQKAFETGNFTDFASVYADKAVLFPPGHFSLYGRQGAMKMAQDKRQAGFTSVPVQIMDVNSAGDYAWLRGTFRDYQGEKLISEGKITQVWQDIRGQLYLLYELVNYNLPRPDDQGDALGDPVAKQKIIPFLKRLEYLYKIGDLKTLTELYGPKSKILPGDSPTHFGREGAQSIYQNMKNSGIDTITYNPVEADQEGSTITLRGYYRNLKRNAVVSEGKFLRIFKEITPGNFTIQYDCFSDDYKAANQPEIIKQSKQLSQDLEAAMKSSDPNAMLSLYSPNAVSMSPGTSGKSGKEGLAHLFQSFKDRGLTKTIQNIDMIPAGDWVIVVGTFQDTMEGLVQSEGKYINILFNDKLLVDSDTSNLN